MHTGLLTLLILSASLFMTATARAQYMQWGTGMAMGQQQGCGFQQQPQQQPRSTDWASVAANVGTGLVAMYMGYQNNKMVAQYNSNLGWPTQSSPTWSYGLPYMTAGLYGALGGGNSQASFGCSSSRCRTINPVIKR